MDSFTIILSFLQLWYPLEAQKNIASTGTASQSSIFTWRTSNFTIDLSADLAITGPPTNDFFSRSCALTDTNHNEAWWMLAFPVDTVFISTVKIFHRSDTIFLFEYYSLYISNTSISSETHPPKGDLCYKDAGTYPPSFTEIHDCNTIGKNVIIYINRTGFGYGALLQLCDVQVLGCYKGWSGKDCTVPCPDNCFNKQCYPNNRTCVWGQWPDNCLRDIRDSASGVCSDGCKSGLAGQYCDKYNLASNKMTVLQPPDINTISGVVIDGDKTTNSCVKTSGNVSWLQINLMGLTVITAIHLSFENDYTVQRHSEGHVIHVTNTSGSWEGGLQFSLNASSGFPYLIYNTGHVIGRYVIYVPKATNGISFTDICEIEVIGCPFNKYGLHCNKTCPANCYGPCHLETGKCLFGCKDGWVDSFCEKPCTSPYFGNSCKNICNCLNGALCNHVNGSCPPDGCKKGWEGQSCSKACSLGYFGFNCNESCDGCLSSSCEREFGVCTDTFGCKPGWEFGYLKCDKACQNGSFGDCKSRCYCLEGTCIKSTGSCRDSKCQKGWMGETCSKECNNGTYGFNCAKSCYNCKNHSCDRFEGYCAFGCIDGFHGHQCQLLVSSLTEEKYQNDLISAVVGTFFLTVGSCITIFLLIFWRLRRFYKKTIQKHTGQYENQSFSRSISGTNYEENIPVSSEQLYDVIA